MHSATQNPGYRAPVCYCSILIALVLWTNRPLSQNASNTAGSDPCSRISASLVAGGSGAADAGTSGLGHMERLAR